MDTRWTEGEVKELLTAHQRLIDRADEVAAELERIAMPLLQDVVDRNFTFLQLPGEEPTVKVDVQALSLLKLDKKPWTYSFPLRYLWEDGWQVEIFLAQDQQANLGKEA